ncbi:hypothetical protein FB567DRAFT_225695 [Paraphoma chrysanthemicola]|uniref:Uncharacterized protein n=1 Tax=Paraphoma chrysanthemicola TaxID=798071 RepID=A0A8K0QSJ5_9PLEO|nr:hypothetical protein FB567DRAFT_225695 [Paraphoma chrysanthemicola]
MGACWPQNNTPQVCFAQHRSCMRVSAERVCQPLLFAAYPYLRSITAARACGTITANSISAQHVDLGTQDATCAEQQRGFRMWHHSLAIVGRTSWFATRPPPQTQALRLETLILASTSCIMQVARTCRTHSHLHLDVLPPSGLGLKRDSREACRPCAWTSSSLSEVERSDILAPLTLCFEHLSGFIYSKPSHAWKSGCIDAIHVSRHRMAIHLDISAACLLRQVELQWSASNEIQHFALHSSAYYESCFPVILTFLEATCS